MGGTAPREAAVLLLLYPGPGGEPFVPFFRRTEHLTRHQGQISLPGGSRDPGDGSLADTARREAWEELGIDPAGYEIVGELDPTFTAVSNFVVKPFVAVSNRRPAFRADPYEVAELLEVPLAQLEDRARWREELMERPGGRRLVKFYDWGDHMIWGLTARIVDQFLRSRVCQNARSAFERRVRDRGPGA